MQTGPRVVEVDDPADERLVELTGLTDAAARARAEAVHGCFVVEGLLALEAAVASPYPLRSVLVAERKAGRVLPLLEAVPVEVFVGSDALLEAVTGFPIHRGVVASAGRLPLADAGDLVSGARRVVVLEGVNDHENVGALFRNAAAFGVDAVLLDPTCADPLYRRAVRVSLGHVLHVRWTRCGELPGGLGVLRETGLRTVALTPGGETDVRALDPAPPTAWLVGAEGPGLTADTMFGADVRARIPLADGVDSLNVATATAVALALTAS